MERIVVYNYRLDTLQVLIKKFYSLAEVSFYRQFMASLHRLSEGSLEYFFKRRLYTLSKVRLYRQDVGGL